MHPSMPTRTDDAVPRPSSFSALDMWKENFVGSGLTVCVFGRGGGGGRGAKEKRPKGLREMKKNTCASPLIYYSPLRFSSQLTADYPDAVVPQRADHPRHVRAVSVPVGHRIAVPGLRPRHLDRPPAVVFRIDHLRQILVEGIVPGVDYADLHGGVGVPIGTSARAQPHLRHLRERQAVL